MARRWAVSAGVLALFALAAACGQGEGEDRPAGVEIIGGAGSVSVSGVVEGYGEELYEPSTDQSLNLAIGLDLKAMRDLMAVAVGGDPVDWAAVTAIYEQGEYQLEPGGSLRTLTELALGASDEAFPDAIAVYGSEGFIDGIVREGLTGSGDRGEGLRDNSRRQVVDKGVQMLMYGEAIAYLAVAEESFADGDADAASEAIDAAWATLSGARDENGSPNNGLLATGISREDDFGFQGQISRPLEASLYAALVAGQQENAEAFETELTESRQYLNTIMYLSVLRYANVLPGDARASDREAHLAEGWTFFQSIRAQVNQASPGAAATIEAAYSRPADEKFDSSLAADVYAALNEPAVLSALAIPPAFQVDAP